MLACWPAPICAQAPSRTSGVSDSLTPEEQQRRRAKLAIDKLINQIRDAYMAGQYQQVLELVDEAEKTDPDNKTFLMYREWAREKLLAGETGPPKPRFAPPTHQEEPSTFPVALPVAAATPAPPAATPVPTPVPTPATTPGVVTSDATDSNLLTYILASVLGLVVLIGGGLFAYGQLMGKRRTPAKPLTPAAKLKEPDQDEEPAPSASPLPAQSPLAPASSLGAPAASASSSSGLASALAQPQGGGLMFGSALSSPLFGTATATEAVSPEQGSAPAASPPAAEVFSSAAPVAVAPETQEPSKQSNAITFDLPPVLPDDSPATPAGRPSPPKTEPRSGETISFGSLGLVDSSGVVTPPPPVNLDEVRVPPPPPASSTPTISLDDISSLVPHRPEDKPEPPKPVAPAVAPLSLDEVAKPRSAGAPPSAPPAASSPAMISLDDLMAGPATPARAVSEQDVTETKIPVSAPPPVSPGPVPPAPVATIQLSDDTRLPLGVQPGEDTLHGQETIQLTPSELPPAPTREAVLRMEDALSETKSVAGPEVSAFADTVASAPPVSGRPGLSAATDNTPSPDTGSFYVSSKPGDKNVDERSERMFRDQCARAKEAMAKKNYKQAVHYLSIAAAIHPEDEEVRGLLREAREAKRKQEAGA
ncbi:MAG: hypothetical protein N2111_04750 [Candidatus Sumerlaeaceae bacterium]|nr:hypothetical protein [Candidatus Sumerlaeaceae bacterium]